MASMVVHDRRLLGGTPAFYNYVMQVNATTPIGNIINVVARRAREVGKLKRLHILCHGYEGHFDLSARQTVLDGRGGFGLELGQQGLNLGNYGLTSAWKGLVDLIVVFSCSPADTGSGNEGTRADGRRFCGYLALSTGAKVIAARDTQSYNSVNMAIPIDFGDWEGTVFEFSSANPDGIPVADPSIYKTQRSRADAAAA